MQGKVSISEVSKAEHHMLLLVQARLILGQKDTELHKSESLLQSINSRS